MRRKYQQGQYIKLIGDDAGGIYSTVCTELESMNNRETISYLHVNKYYREIEHKKYLAQLERIQKKYIDNGKQLRTNCIANFGNNPSPMNSAIRYYAALRLKLFARSAIEMIERKSVGRLEFRQFGRKKRFMAKMMKTMRPNNEMAVIAVGPSPIHQNSCIGGNSRGPLNAISNSFAENMDTVMLGEQYTSIRCSKCHFPTRYTTATKRSVYWAICNPTQTILPEPNMYCKMKLMNNRSSASFKRCQLRGRGEIQRTHMHRDGNATGNASRNILMLLICKLSGIKRPAQFSHPRPN